MSTSSVPVTPSPSCLIHSPYHCNISSDSSLVPAWPNSSDFVPITSDFIPSPQSPPHVANQVPSSPPVHSGADPGSETLAPRSPRKRPRLRSSPPEHTRLSSRLPVDIEFVHVSNVNLRHLMFFCQSFCSAVCVRPYKLRRTFCNRFRIGGTWTADPSSKGE